MKKHIKEGLVTKHNVLAPPPRSYLYVEYRRTDKPNPYNPLDEGA
jgi:hypothetical protein